MTSAHRHQDTDSDAGDPRPWAWSWSWSWPCPCLRSRGCDESVTSGTNERKRPCGECADKPTDKSTVGKSVGNASCASIRRRARRLAAPLCSTRSDADGCVQHAGRGAWSNDKSNDKNKHKHKDGDKGTHDSRSDMHLDCRSVSMVRSECRGSAAIVKRLLRPFGPQQHLRCTPDPDSGQVSVYGQNQRHDQTGSQSSINTHNARRPTTTTTCKQGQGVALPSRSMQIPQPITLQRRQPSSSPSSSPLSSPSSPPSPSPSTSLSAVTNIQDQDPSVIILPPTSTFPTVASTETPTTAPTRPLPVAIIVTIVLGTIAGVVVLLLAVLLLHIQLKRRRRGQQSHCPSPQSDTKSPSSASASANASSTLLISSAPTSPCPKRPPPMAPGSDEPEHRNGSLNFNLNLVRPAPGPGQLRAPPRLGERQFHQATRSEGFIDTRPSRAVHHTRWGKPSSLGAIPSVPPEAALSLPEPARPGTGHSHGHGRSRSRSRSRTPQYRVFPPNTTAPPSPRTHKPAASLTSTTSSTTLRGDATSPPPTPKYMLAAPGPPPSRALPATPLKYWQVNPLTPPLDAQMDHVRSEDIGLAIGSPSQEKREKRPRLDERDMERLGGTYSPFRR